MVVSEKYFCGGENPWTKSLNPCFDGWWYRRYFDYDEVVEIDMVLILVLMDGGIGVTLTHFEGKNAES